MENIDFDLLVCFGCIHSSVPYKCRGKIPIGYDEQLRLRREYRRKGIIWHGFCSAREEAAR